MELQKSLKFDSCVELLNSLKLCCLQYLYGQSKTSHISFGNAKKVHSLLWLLLVLGAKSHVSTLDTYLYCRTNYLVGCNVREKNLFFSFNSFSGFILYVNQRPYNYLIMMQCNYDVILDYKNRFFDCNCAAVCCCE